MTKATKQRAINRANKLKRLIAIDATNDIVIRTLRSLVESLRLHDYYIEPDMIFPEIERPEDES